MKIEIKNGKIINVPVNKEDIIRISFEDIPGQSTGITWDYETGDLRGWTKTGNAFKFQPPMEIILRPAIVVSLPIIKANIRLDVSKNAWGPPIPPVRFSATGHEEPLLLSLSPFPALLSVS
jgi:hypothetical protein